jgi:hypothetical protein
VSSIGQPHGPDIRIPPREQRPVLLAHEQVLLDRRGGGFSQAIQGVEFEVVVVDAAVAILDVGVQYGAERRAPARSGKATPTTTAEVPL